MKLRQLQWLFVTLLLAVLPFATAVAQEDAPYGNSSRIDSSTQNSDPSGRVARIQYMTGEVSMQPGGANDWIAANMNRPLTTADRIWTDKNSKAELNVGGGYLRLNSETSLTLSSVSDNTVQLELDQGTLSLTVRHLEPGEIYEIDTPNTAFTVMKPGVYRFDVYPNEDQTWVTVRQGYGEATGRANAVKVKAGEQMRFRGANSLEHTAEAAPAPDGFDDWARVRDQRLNNSTSARYVSPGVVGYEDLDNYGYWRTVAPYGPVWVPSTVAVGWAPYRYGHWAWIDPWGWTWVDDAPWGFAPFHYGRWVYTGGYWGWAPGPYRFYRPCYAPALVAWVGGPGFGIGFGFGSGFGVSFGWFPLGWGEPFYPWYSGWRGRGLSSNYIRNVNITNTNITNITNITNNYYNNNITNTHYVNRTVAGAVTAAPKSAIASAEPINRVGTVVPAAQVGRAQIVRGVDANPTRAAVLGGQAPRTNAVPASATANRPVITRMTPPARPAPIEARGNAAVGGAGVAPNHNPAAAQNATSSAAAPNAQAGHYVPRPPSAGGAAPAARGNDTAVARESVSSTPAHNVPRPPTQNGNGAGNNDVQRTSPTVGNNNAQHTSPTFEAGPASHNVPRPPQNNGYVGGQNGNMNSNSQAVHPTIEPRAVPRAPSSEAAPHSYTPPAARESAPPAHEAAPPSHAAPQNKPKDNPGSAYVPRPPANYSYRPSPSYSASASPNVPPRGAYSGAPNSQYGGAASRSSYPSAAPAYHANPQPYTPAPSYRSGGSYTPAPSYHAQSAGPSVPHYSAPPSYGGGGGHYSAPAGGGGGGHYSAPSGGGGSHSAGGGSHGSGGGAHGR